MSITIRNDGELVTAAIIGEIDHHSARHFREELDCVLEHAMPKLLMLDFAEVSFMDSSGIGFIFGRLRLLDTFGGTIAIKNAPPRIKRLLFLGGAGSFVLSEEEAREAEKK